MNGMYGLERREQNKDKSKHRIQMSLSSVLLPFAVVTSSCLSSCFSSLFLSELLGFWTLSIVWNSKY
jgi:hypothetical protein